MTSKLYFVIFALTITAVNVLYLLYDKDLNIVIYSQTGRLTFFVLVLSYVYLLFSSSVWRKMTKIVFCIFCLMFLIVTSTFISISGFEEINIVMYSIYWSSVFLFAYSFVKQNPEKLQFAVNVMLWTIPVIAISFAHIAMSYRSFSSDVALNKSYYLLCLLPFVLMIKNKYLQTFLAMLIAIAMLISFKRGGALAMLVCILIYNIIDVFYEKRTSRQYLTRIVSLSVFIMAGLFFINNYFADESFRMIERFRDLQSDEGSGRINIWLMTSELQFRSDFIGWIFGNGYNAVLKSINISAHNDFLEVLYDYGIIVFIFYLLLSFYLIGYCIKMFKFRSPLFAPFTSSCVLFLILSSLSHLIIYPTYFINITLFWGLSIAGFESEVEQNKFFYQNNKVNTYFQQRNL